MGMASTQFLCWVGDNELSYLLLTTMKSNFMTFFTFLEVCLPQSLQVEPSMCFVLDPLIYSSLPLLQHVIWLFLPISNSNDITWEMNSQQRYLHCPCPKPRIFGSIISEHYSISRLLVMKAYQLSSKGMKHLYVGMEKLMERDVWSVLSGHQRKRKHIIISLYLESKDFDLHLLHHTMLIIPLIVREERDYRPFSWEENQDPNGCHDPARLI